MPAQRTFDLFLLTLIAPIAVATSAEEPAPQLLDASPAEVLEEVRVVAPRMDMGVDFYIDPDIVLDADAISAFAVNDVGELLDELAPELDSGRQRPNSNRVILVNGQRIANFNEIRRYPPEAIAAVEIYPEDVALRYGFRADQKVVNFVLQPRFRAVTTRFVNRGWGETDGGSGGETTEFDAGYLHVQDVARINVDIDTERQLPLHDSDRDVPANQQLRDASLTGNVYAVDAELDSRLSALLGEPALSATLPAASDAFAPVDLVGTANNPVFTDARPLRTLIADREQRALSGSYSNLFADRISATLYGAYREEDNRTEQGLARLSYRVPAEHPRSPFDSDVDVERLLQIPLTRTQDSTRYEANATFAADWRGVALSWISTYANEERDATTVQGLNADAFLTPLNTLDATVDPFAPDELIEPQVQFDATSSSAWSSEFTARGILADLPNGPIQSSARVLWQSNSRLAETRNDLGLVSNRVDRDIAEARFSLDAPLFRHEQLGRMSLNFNTELADYSDFGPLSVIGAGFTWKPFSRLRINSSLTREEAAPGMEQLGDPITRIPNRRTFDFETAATVDALEISGGNPTLQAELREVLNVNARIRLQKKPWFALIFDYSDVVVDQPILAFPNQNAELEGAFPERYERNELGQLTVFDTRPINLEQEHRREFRWMLRYNREFDPPASSGSKGRGEANASGNAGASGTGRAASANSKAGQRGPRIRLALNHVITLQDELTLASGIAPIDYVGVASAGRRRGGAEHFVSLRGTYVYRNVAARLNASWQDATESLSNRAGTLSFDSLFRADLDLAYFFRAESPWVQRIPSLEGSRVKLSMLNVFDSKPQVRDQSGLTPLGSTEDELMPRGRHFALEFRKVFR